MTKQDFELIARTVRDEREAAMRGVVLSAKDACDQMADAFARRLASTNPRFDRARFLRACGVED